MTEASGQFVAVDLDFMLFGQRLNFGKGRGPPQLMRYGEGHGKRLKANFF
jgi:hypothetical protein